MRINEYGFQLTWRDATMQLSTEEISNILGFIKNLQFVYTWDQYTTHVSSKRPHEYRLDVFLYGSIIRK